jgi:hypothetical protein
MKSLIWLVEGLLLDEGVQCSVAHHRDLNTIRSRVAHEGVSFLTITLPSFCDAFEKALRSGRLTTSDFPAFSKSGSSGCLPAFLQGFTGQVFDKVTGALYEKPSIDCIRAVRQICRFAKKVKIDCTPQRVAAALEGYLQCEAQVRDTDPLASEYIGYFRAVSYELWGNLFKDFYIHDLVPKHGPGATAERISGNQKYRLKKWHTRLEPYFPSDAYCCTLQGAALGYLEEIDFICAEQEQPVRVIVVPKDLKSPRIIAIEPVCMQYTQQALMSYIVKTLESKTVNGRQNPAYRRVNFTRQDINQRLALWSSSSGRLTTMDLSEASDRVHSSLVNEMLTSVPDLRGATFACRSQRANVPGSSGQNLVELAKFASMGSALCFPIEAMVFFTIIIAARLKERGAPVTSKAVIQMAKDTYVYGDDIIVPVDETPTVIRALTSFGLKVNERKTFGSGKFRESCGMDAYDGERVTPVYLRCLPPANGRDADAISSFVSLRNQLYLTGLWRTCERVQTLVERQTGKLPYVTEQSAGLGWVSFRYPCSIGRWNCTLHRYEVYGLTVKTQMREDEISGYPALLKFFLKSKDERSDSSESTRARIGVSLLSKLQTVDKLHAKRSVKSGTSYIKRRWFQPY